MENHAQSGLDFLGISASVGDDRPNGLRDVGVASVDAGRFGR